MFEFLFKRPAKKSVKPVDAPAPSPSSKSATTLPSSTLAKLAAVAQADALGSDESLAAQFILDCEFADARLKAAAHICSRPILERVQQAMRNTDRRVSKLMQSRLDALTQQESDEKLARQCIAQAQQLALEPILTPNQVADLDRTWQSVALVPETVRSTFAQARGVLSARLEAQAALQRSLIDILAELNRMMLAPDAVAPGDSEQILARMAQDIARHAAAPEAQSLPKHLLAEFTQNHQRFQKTLSALQQYSASIAARQEALERWEAKELVHLKIDALEREWRALPVLQNNDILAPLQERFDALLKGVAGSRATKDIASQQVKQDTLQHFSSALDSLEKALQEGALQLAAEHDKTLRAMDFKAVRLSGEHTEQLARARAELGRLQGWAKWGGNVSREELLKAAEGLPQQSLAPLELAKKVGSLRERWKSLEVSAGSASKELWQRFDAACTSAYAPAAEHFKKLAEEREKNSAKARAMIAEVKQFATTLNLNETGAGGVDWKALAGYCMQTPQAWQRLGTVERKEKKQLDAEFDAAMQALAGPLAAQRLSEIRLREKLIAEATNLNPGERNALDNLRALQERWQVQAKSLPLERKGEQELWTRFRSACDAVFAKRKETASAADAERKQHLQTKESLCVALETSRSAAESVITKLIRDTKDSWSKTGPVPRAAEESIEARYKTAMAALHNQLGQFKAAALAAESAALHGKMMLCHSIEQSLVSGSAMDAEQLQSAASDWQNFASLPAEIEKKMQARFDAACKAAQSNDRQYAAAIEKNSPVLAQEVLRLEIFMGVESPAELAQERMKLQIEVLQASLKSGSKSSQPLSLSAQLGSLYSLPTAMDAQMMRRIEKLIAGSGNNVKT